MFFADSMDDTGIKAAIDTDGVILLMPYMDNPTKFANGAYDFTVESTAGATSWWVSYSLAIGNKPVAVSEKLANRAASVGIYNTTTAATSAQFVKGNAEAFMIAR